VNISYFFSRDTPCGASISAAATPSRSEIDVRVADSDSKARKVTGKRVGGGDQDRVACVGCWGWPWEIGNRVR